MWRGGNCGEGGGRLCEWIDVHVKTWRYRRELLFGGSVARSLVEVLRRERGEP